MTPLIFWASVAAEVVVGSLAATLVIAAGVVLGLMIARAVLAARRFILARIE